MDLEKIYSENAKSVYRYAFSRLNSKENAEDVLSEVFTRFCKDFESFKSRNIEPKAWLIGITRNVLKELYRQDFETNSIEDVSEMPNDEDSIETKIIDEEMKKDLLKVLDTLSPDVKDIIILKIWEEMTFEEIAKAIEVNESTVKTKYFRGIKLIKEKLEGIYRKDNRYAMLTASYIAALTLAIGAEEKYMLSQGVYSSILNMLQSNFSNLFLNTAIMETTSNTAPVAGSAIEATKSASGAVVKTAPKYLYPIIATATAVVLVGGGIGGYIYANRDKDTNSSTSSSTSSSSISTSTSDASTTSTASSTTSTASSSTSSTSSDDWKEQKVEITSYLQTKPYAEFTFKIPSNATISKTTGGDGEVAVIEGDDFSFYLYRPYEVIFPFSYQNKTLVESSSGFGEVYRVSDRIQGGSPADEYYYMNNLTLSGSCNAGGNEIPAPCGYHQVVFNSNKSNYTAYCKTTSTEGLKDCDQIVKELSVLVL